MFDQRTEQILKTVNKNCVNGYKILNAADFGEADGLEERLDVLNNTGYILLRYRGDGEYLVGSTKTGNDYFNKRENEIVFEATICRKTAIYALIGALIGGIVACSVTFFMGLLAR